MKSTTFIYTLSDKSGNIRYIQNELNIDSGNVSSCCRGIVKSAGGFLWKYKKT